MTLASQLNGRVDIQSFSFTTTSGKRVKTFTPKYAGIPCFITDANPRSDQRFARENMAVTHKVVLVSQGGYGLVNVTITQGEKAVFGARSFEVLGVANPGQMNVMLILYTNEIRA